MKRKLYARELLEALVTEKELSILEIASSQLKNDEKIQQLLSE
jgi:hypothetical protein